MNIQTREIQPPVTPIKPTKYYYADFLDYRVETDNPNNMLTIYKKGNFYLSIYTMQGFDETIFNPEFVTFVRDFQQAVRRQIQAEMNAPSKFIEGQE